MVERRTTAEAAVGWIGVARASAATAALFLGGLLLPIGGPLLMALTPQPGLRLSQADHGYALTFVVALAAAGVGLAGGAAPAVFYLVSFGLLTITLPALLRRDWSIEVTIGLATAGVAVAILGVALCVSSPSELWIALRAGLEQVREEAVRVYAHAGLAPAMIHDLEDGSARVIDVVLRLAPALFLVSIAAVVLINVQLLRRSQRVRGLVPVFGDLTRWECPPELVWILIASGYGLFVASGALEAIATNVLAVLLVVYFCQGLVIAQFYMRRWRSPFWVIGFVYLFIVVEWLLATGVTLLGLFDLWADFRRLNPRPVEED
jgi:uncharacterized protein YybS (DUF2232 family)